MSHSRRARIVATCVALALAACQRGAPTASAPRGAGDYAAHDWVMPSPSGAAEPDLVGTPDGRLLLGWIDASAGRRNALQFAQWGDGHWQSAPRTIVVGDSLVANGADVPHLAATADGALWVQWLQRAPGATGNDLMLSRSADGGFNWSPPERINAASDGAEHGFASLWPAARDRIGVAWLDGAPPHAPASSADATSLHATAYDMGLRSAPATTIDARACDCCQTDAATTARGALLVYRDRAPGDVRDIAATRLEGGHWSTPSMVHADGWTMPACPVNGPAVATSGDNAVAAWFTAAGDTPAVELARSRDAGAHFDPPVRVEQGPAVQGRVDVALDARQAWILWVSGNAPARTLWLARYAPDLSRPLQRLRLATLQSGGPGAGYPRLQVVDDAAYVVWSDSDGRQAQLHGVVVDR